MRRRYRNSQGFSLIEALVALAIAAAVITGFYASLSTGLQLRTRATDQAEAIFAASAILDRVGVDIPLRLGTQQEGATADGNAWRLIISGNPPADMPTAPIGDGTLAYISVAVTGTQDVVLRSVRYVQSPL